MTVMKNGLICMILGEEDPAATSGDLSPFHPHSPAMNHPSVGWFSSPTSPLHVDPFLSIEVVSALFNAPRTCPVCDQLPQRPCLPGFLPGFLLFIFFPHYGKTNAVLNKEPKILKEIETLIT